MRIAILITVIVIVVEAFMKMRYGYLFHKYLCDKYPDKRYLTILDLKGEINGFKTFSNLFNNSEQELNDDYLTKMKYKSRLWLLICVSTVISVPILLGVISACLSVMNE